MSADISEGEFYAGIVLIVDGEGYLSCLEAYAIGEEPVRQFPPVEQIHAHPQW